jgi:hypothetical protein
VVIKNEVARCQWLMPVISGGRDQEDLGSRLAWANSSRGLILKIPNTKKG